MREAPRRASPMEALNHVPMAELMKVTPSRICGPAHSTAIRPKYTVRRSLRAAPGTRVARCRSRRTTWNAAMPNRIRGKVTATARARVFAVGDARGDVADELAREGEDHADEDDVQQQEHEKPARRGLGRGGTPAHRGISARVHGVVNLPPAPARETMVRGGMSRTGSNWTCAAT